MKRTLLFLFALLVLTAGASAQPRVQGKAIGFEEYTFANRPSPPSSGEGHTIYVTDCADATCASGGGSTVVQQRWNGTAWVTVSGGVGGGGTPGGSSKSIQYNNAGAFGGVGPGSDGQYVAYASGDPVLITPGLPGVAVSGTSLTLTSAHNMTRVNMTSASAKSVDNTGGEAAGYYTQLRNAGGGTLTFTPVSGTVNDAASFSCNTQYAILELRTDGTNWESRCNPPSTLHTSKVWLEAAGCQNTSATLMWDTPTSNPAVAACVTGTNTQKGVADFADSSNLSMQRTLLLPSDWTGAIDVKFKWFTSATSGDVVWQIATACVADGETDDPSFNTASTVTDTAKSTANQTNDATITGITATGCAAGELLHLKVFRDAAHASDNLAATARLIGIELTLRRNP